MLRLGGFIDVFISGCFKAQTVLPGWGSNRPHIGIYDSFLLVPVLEAVEGRNLEFERGTTDVLTMKMLKLKTFSRRLRLVIIELLFRMSS